MPIKKNIQEKEITLFARKLSRQREVECGLYLVTDSSVMTGRFGADSRVTLYDVLPSHGSTEQPDLLLSQEEGEDAAPESSGWYGEVGVSEGEHVSGSPAQVEIVRQAGHPGGLLLPPHGVGPVQSDDGLAGVADLLAQNYQH